MSREHASNLDLSSQLTEARGHLLAATKLREDLEVSGSALKAEMADLLKDKAHLQANLHDANKSHSLAASAACVNESQLGSTLKERDSEIIEVSNFIHLRYHTFFIR